jgi:DNA polymerase III subunit delta'
MSFADLIGHQKQLAILRSALARQRLHHAYLFLGPEGVGKRTVAVACAKAIHCQELANDFCGSCVNCARIADGNHPDVRTIEPLADKKEISIQQIREIERELNYRSFTGKRKIAIVDPATLMNSAAQNALLKTLEEPPQESLIILLAANEGMLLPTLRSRCLRLSFAPLPRQEVAAYLQSKQGTSAAEAEFLAALSMGSIGVAVALDKDELIERRRVWTGILSSLKARDYQSAMAAAESLAGNRDEALKFLSWAESWYRDLLIYRVTNKADELVNLDMLEQIEQQAADANIDGLRASMERTVGAVAAIQRNLNRRMVLERLLFSVAEQR